MVIIALGGEQRWLVSSLRLQRVSTLKLLAADHLHMYPIDVQFQVLSPRGAWEVNANMTALVQL